MLQDVQKPKNYLDNINGHAPEGHGRGIFDSSKALGDVLDERSNNNRLSTESIKQESHRQVSVSFNDIQGDPLRAGVLWPEGVGAVWGLTDLSKPNPVESLFVVTGLRPEEQRTEKGFFGRTVKYIPSSIHGWLVSPHDRWSTERIPLVDETETYASEFQMALLGTQLVWGTREIQNDNSNLTKRTASGLYVTPGATEAALMVTSAILLPEARGARINDGSVKPRERALREVGCWGHNKNEGLTISPQAIFESTHRLQARPFFLDGSNGRYKLTGLAEKEFGIQPYIRLSEKPFTPDLQTMWDTYVYTLNAHHISQRESRVQTRNQIPAIVGRMVDATVELPSMADLTVVEAQRRSTHKIIGSFNA